MTARASATTTFAVSAGVPATFDASGYNALSWTLVGEVTSIGDFGNEWGVNGHTPVALKGVQKIKTGFDPGDLGIEMALDTDDAGQVLMKAALASTSLYAFRITTTVGPLDKYYFQGAVKSFKVKVGDQKATLAASASIAITTSNTDVAIVEVLG
jgi:hypothetical protein